MFLKITGVLSLIFTIINITYIIGYGDIMNIASCCLRIGFHFDLNSHPSSPQINILGLSTSPFLDLFSFFSDVLPKLVFILSFYLLVFDSFVGLFEYDCNSNTKIFLFLVGFLLKFLFLSTKRQAAKY